MQSSIWISLLQILLLHIIVGKLGEPHRKTIILKLICIENKIKISYIAITRTQTEMISILNVFLAVLVSRRQRVDRAEVKKSSFHSE